MKVTVISEPNSMGFKAYHHLRNTIREEQIYRLTAMVFTYYLLDLFGKINIINIQIVFLSRLL